jgi:hypothetical protein
MGMPNDGMLDHIPTMFRSPTVNLQLHISRSLTYDQF